MKKYETLNVQCLKKSTAENSGFRFSTFRRARLKSAISGQSSARAHLPWAVIYLIKQQKGDVLVVVVSSDMERRHSVLALGVDRRFSRQQQPSHLQVAVLGRQVERGEPLLGRRRLRGVVVQQYRRHLAGEEGKNNVKRGKTENPRISFTSPASKKVNYFAKIREYLWHRRPKR